MTTVYPPVGFHFQVSFAIPDVSVTERDFRFREVSGLTMELEEETYNEGGVNHFVHKFPVRARYPDLVLKRGLLTDSAVAKWCADAIQNFDITPATVWVTLLNETHEPLRTYTFTNAWPKRWSVSDFDAESSAIVVESLELAYQQYRVS